MLGPLRKVLVRLGTMKKVLVRLGPPKKVSVRLGPLKSRNMFIVYCFTLNYGWCDLVELDGWSHVFCTYFLDILLQFK